MTLQARQQSFEALTRPLLDSLYRTALRMTQEKQAAEDLVQDTCLKAFRAFHRFEANTNYRAWIFKIMTNTCIDRRRAQSEMRMLDLDELGEGIFAGSSARTSGQAALVLPFPGVTGSDPEADLQNKKFREAALQSVSKMPPDQRLVLVLAIFEEFSYAEIAQVVGCPVGTVRSRLSRGRQQLQEDLARFVKSEAEAPGSGSLCDERQQDDGGSATRRK